MNNLKVVRWAVVLAMARTALVGLDVVRAEEGEPAPPPPEASFHADEEYPDVYINDSFEANELLETARRLTERQRWEEAARLLDRVVAKYGDKLVRRASGRYGAIPDRVREVLASWPPEGQGVYQRLFEIQAREQFQTVVEARRLEELYDLLDRYYGTKIGIEIADTLAQLAIEAGAFAHAESIYRRLLRDHPRVRGSPGEILSRLALVAALRGDAEAARRYVEQAAAAAPHPTLRWMGEDRPLAEVVEERLVGGLRVTRAEVRFAWPTFGGGNDRNGIMRFQMEEAASLWRFDRTDGGWMRTLLEEDRSAGFQRVLESGRFLTMNPIVAQDRVFIHNAFLVRAIRADTGVLAWTYAPLQGPTAVRVDFEGSAVGWYGATYDEGRLYAVLGEEPFSYYGGGLPAMPSTLICLDAANGKEIWRTRDAGFDEAFSQCVFDPSPLVTKGKVFVVVRRRRSFGFEDCYLCRYDAGRGALESRVHLGGASIGGFGFRRATLSIPTLVGDAVVVVTNLGTVAAVDQHSGRVLWLRLYRREVDPQRDSGGRRATVPWHYNPVLVDGDRVVCYPLDSSGVLVLEVGSGEIRFGIPAAVLANAASLFGIRGHILYGAGDAAFAFDLAAERSLWVAPLPPDEHLYGRGLLTEDRLLVPTRAHLCSYTLEGELARRVPWESPEDAGNIVAMPDRLIIVGNDRVSAYAPKNEVWAALRERMAAIPNDPVPALDMAQVALRGGDTGEALSALEQAVERVGGFTAPLDPDLKRRFFEGSTALAGKLASGASADGEAAIRVLGYAAQCPPDLEAEIAYRVRLAELHEEAGRPAAAVEVYQQILADRSLRSAPAGTNGEARETAGTMSRRQIERLIGLHGRSVYARCEARAREGLEAGVRGGDPAFLERIVEIYPNAEAAPRALIEAAKTLRQTGRSLDAVRRLSTVYSRYGEQIDGPAVMRLIADCYVDAGHPESAWSWLTKAARRYPTALLEHEGRQVSLTEYRARLADVRAAVEPSRPRMRLPLERTFVRTFDAPCYLLDPLYRDHPQTAWDSYYVYSDARLYLFDVAREGEAPAEPVRAGEAPAEQVRAGEAPAEQVREAMRWPGPVSCRMMPQLLLATPDRAVFATRHQVFALDPRNGRRVWEYGKYPADLDDELADHEMFTSFRVHAVGAGRIVSLQDSGRAACLELGSGRVLWETTSEFRANGPVAMSDLWVAYSAGRGGQDAYCILDLDTGEPLQIIEPPDDRRAERLLAALENLVVATTQTLRAYDPWTAEPLWSVDRGRYIAADTVQVDLDGVYFSDDVRFLVKLDLEKGRLLWQSDRLPFRFPDSLTVALERDQVLVSTERGACALDTFDGRLRWEGTVPEDALLGKRFVSDTYLVAIDTRTHAGETPYTAYFFDHREGQGRIAAQGGVLRLGEFEDIRSITVRDHALLLATDHTLHGWYRPNGSDEAPGR